MLHTPWDAQLAEEQRSILWSSWGLQGERHCLEEGRLSLPFSCRHSWVEDLNHPSPINRCLAQGANARPTLPQSLRGIG